MNVYNLVVTPSIIGYRVSYMTGRNRNKLVRYVAVTCSCIDTVKIFRCEFKVITFEKVYFRRTDNSFDTE